MGLWFDSISAFQTKYWKRILPLKARKWRYIDYKDSEALELSISRATAVAKPRDAVLNFNTIVTPLAVDIFLYRLQSWQVNLREKKCRSTWHMMGDRNVDGWVMCRVSWSCDSRCQGEAWALAVSMICRCIVSIKPSPLSTHASRGNG